MNIKIKELKIISDKRGSVRKMISSQDPEFTKFGEIYFSTIKKDVVKAWMKNKTATTNYTLIQGSVKLVLVENEEIKEIHLDSKEGKLITISPGIWRGIENTGQTEAIIADLMDRPYDEKDLERKNPEELTEIWKK